MKRFLFSSKRDTVNSPIFSGLEFYNVYKEARFLKDPENIETILSKGYELRQMLKKVAPGEVVALEGMFLYQDYDLLVKKTGPNIEIKRHEFTANRLTGLVAAYAFENHRKYDTIKSSEAEALGLKWNNLDIPMCRFYLSAVSGTEHFYRQFQYLPLICAIRKLHLKKITIEPVMKMAKIKNPEGICMIEDFKKKFKTVIKIWVKKFPDATKSDLISVMMSFPQLWNVFQSYA